MSRDFQLAELNTVIDSLDMEVVERDETIQIKDVLISQNQAELDKAYLASGNYKELEEKGIVAKEGGFLGLGKSKVVPANLADNEFEQISISQTAKIDIQAKKVELISAHPEDSYQVVSNDSIVEYIQIIKPETFWKKTRMSAPMRVLLVVASAVFFDIRIQDYCFTLLRFELKYSMFVYLW